MHVGKYSTCDYCLSNLTQLCQFCSRPLSDSILVQSCTMSVLIDDFMEMGALFSGKSAV